MAQLVDIELLYQRGRPPLARYIFKHALVRDAAYTSLLKRTRQEVHQRVAQLLETHFPEAVETQPELVAHHYTEADCPEQSVVYWQRAGQHASTRSAYVEAIAHLTKGLELIPTLPDTPERTQRELDLQIALGPTWMVTQGYAAPEVERTYARAEALSQGEESPQHFRALRGLWAFHQVRGEVRAAQELSERLLSLAQTQQSPFPSLEAHRSMGTTLFLHGALDRAQEHLQRGSFLYDPRQRRLPDFLYEDTGMVCLALVSLVLWLRGYPEQALQKGHEAGIQAQELPHPYNMVYAQHAAAGLHALCLEPQTACERAEAAITLAHQHRMPIFAAGGTILRGWVLVKQGQAEEGIAQMHEGLDAQRIIGAELYRPWYQAMLADAYGNMEQSGKGLRILTEALDLVNKNGEFFYEAELYRLKGELLLNQTGPDAHEAETCFHRALDIARCQQAKALELRATMSLSRLWQQQKKQEAARELLAEVYNWFTEGFDTTDLKAARALLEALG